METTMRVKVRCLRWVVGSEGIGHINMDCNETATMIPASATKTYEDLPRLLRPSSLVMMRVPDLMRMMFLCVVRDDTVLGMQIKLWDLHAIVRAYEQAERGEIHDSKAFTFEDSGARHGALAIEAKHWENWDGSIRRICTEVLEERSRTMLAMQSQALLAQGVNFYRLQAPLALCQIVRPQAFPLMGANYTELAIIIPTKLFIPGCGRGSIDVPNFMVCRREWRTPVAVSNISRGNCMISYFSPLATPNPKP